MRSAGIRISMTRSPPGTRLGPEWPIEHETGPGGKRELARLGSPAVHGSPHAGIRALMQAQAPCGLSPGGATVGSQGCNPWKAWREQTAQPRRGDRGITTVAPPGLHGMGVFVFQGLHPWLPT